jgi:hypothetical protein
MCDMKQSSYYLYVFLAVILIMSSCASTKSTAYNAGQPAYSPSGPSSRMAESEGNAAGRAEQRSSRRKKSKSTYKTHNDLVKEYEERMEANAKRHKKEAKLAEKPQYSDPSYFGHKKKPKKRPVGKRKFCKECKIVH